MNKQTEYKTEEFCLLGCNAAQLLNECQFTFQRSISTSIFRVEERAKLTLQTIPEARTLHNHCCENLRSYKI
jgi:hypothetical protein